MQRETALTNSVYRDEVSNNPSRITSLGVIVFSPRNICNHIDIQVDLERSNRNLTLGHQKFVLKIGHALYHLAWFFKLCFMS